METKDRGYLKYKIFLLEQGIKYAEEAKMLGISEATYSRKINRVGYSDFTLDQVRAICKEHKLDANSFFLQQ